MKQSKKGSMAEAGINVLIGYVIAVGSQIAIFPMFGIHIPIGDNFLIGLWFTVISLVRSYVIRRWFNARIHSAAMQLTGEK